MKEKMKFTLLRETKNNYDVFQKLEPREARIIAVNRGVSRDRIILFEGDGNDFVILHETETYGVSSNLKKFKRVKATKRISVKGNRFYVANSNKAKAVVSQATTYSFQESRICYGDDVNRPDLVEKGNPFSTNIITERSILYSKYPFLKFLEDNKMMIALNTVFKKELFTLKKAISHFFGGVQYTQNLKDLIDQRSFDSQPAVMRKAILKECINIHKLNTDLFLDMDYLIDCTKMAKALGKKVDLVWTKRRLIEEHDEWSREINNVILGADDRPLEVRDIYKRFADFIQVPALSTTRELSLEGINQSHCVGGYADQIDSGTCAIIHYKGYTLQIKRTDLFKEDELIAYNAYSSNLAKIKIADGIKRSQFLGYKNKYPPDELVKEIDSLILNFNQNEIIKKEQETERLRTEARRIGKEVEARNPTILADNERHGIYRVHEERGNGVANFYDDDIPF